MRWSLLKQISYFIFNASLTNNNRKLIINKRWNIKFFCPMTTGSKGGKFKSFTCILMFQLLSCVKIQRVSPKPFEMSLIKHAKRNKIIFIKEERKQIKTKRPYIKKSCNFRPIFFKTIPWNIDKLSTPFTLRWFIRLTITFPILNKVFFFLTLGTLRIKALNYPKIPYYAM